MIASSTVLSDLNLVFRVAWDIPDSVREFENRYVFYPIESFPDD